jgi:F-type H+-transporting ATPase subunit delta
MASSRIASRYSKSLFDLAIQENKIEQIKTDMLLIESMCKSSNDLIALLKNPIVKAEDKKVIMLKLIHETDKSTQDFVSFLIDKKREEELPHIALQFVASYNQMKGISQATVVSAVPLSDKNLSQMQSYVEQLLNQSDIQLQNEVDPSIIGGVIVKYEDKLLDKSVSKELREIRKQLIYN